jgi:hypothetical protein
MAKIGFICEGFTEQIFLQSDAFRNLLASLSLESLLVINAEGSGNLLPHNIVGYIARLEKEGADTIVILTDLDADICITKTKERISAREQDVVIIAVKKIVSWFLASIPTMQQLLGQPGFHYAEPEGEIDPFEIINTLLVQHRGRGIGKKTAGKVKLATRMMEIGFNISNAASHTNCPSAQYLLKKLKDISKKIAAGILLVFTCVAASHAQTHKDSVISSIRTTFQRINGDKSLRVVQLDAEEFLEEAPDNGAILRGYFNGDTLDKMVLEVGISYAMRRWEYYFGRGRVVFIYETDKYYRQDTVNGGLDKSNLDLAFEGRYYYENGALIHTIFKGKKKLLESDSNSPADYIKALPEKPEIDGYFKLLEKKLKAHP